MKLDAAIKEIEARLGKLDSIMARLIARAYASLNLADLLALLTEALTARSPARRVSRLKSLMRVWDGEMKKLEGLPAQLVEQFPDWIEAAKLDTRTVIKAQGLSLGFNLDPARERAILKTSRTRFNTYWASETETFRKQVEVTLLEGLDAGRGPRQIARELRERVGVSQVRAERISRTELMRARQAATQASHEALNVTEYEWLHAPPRANRKDRPEHVARSGRIFKYSDPPADGPPGYAINCRCTALPVLPQEDE